MKKSLLLLAISSIGISTPTFAQKNASGDIGAEFDAKLPFDNEESQMTGYAARRNVFVDGNDFYVLSKKNIVKTTVNGKLVYAKKVTLMTGGKEMEACAMLMGNGKIYAFAYGQNKGDKDLTMYKSMIDKETGNPKGAPEKVFNITEGSKNINVWKNHTFWAYSPDSSKIVIASNAFSHNKGMAFFTDVSVAVMDADMKPLWQNTYSAGMDVFMHFAVDNSGNVIGEAGHSGAATNNYFVWKSTGGEPSLLKMPISYGGVTYKFNNQGKMLCAGFYSEKGSYYSKGMMCFTIDIKTQKTEQELKFLSP